MLDKPLDEVTEDDLQDLVDNSIQESKQLEYKEFLDSSNDDDHKTSLLAEVTSFANSRGGDLIIGIAEDDGVPESVGGIPLSGSPDQIVETWGNILRRQTEPKLPTTVYDIATVQTNGGRHIVIVRVNRSWQRPHRVRTNDRFYGRHASGKFPMTVGEIREQMTAGRDRRDQLNEFRTDRISEFLTGDTPVPVEDGPKLLFHLVPYDAFSPGENIDLASGSVRHDSSPVQFLMRAPTGGHGDRFMVDSVTQYVGDRQNPHSFYVRTFRNGAIEGFTNVGFSTEEVRGEEVPYLHAESVEQTLNRALPDYLEFLAEQDLTPPLYAVTTVLDAEEYTLLGDTHSTYDPIPFDREVLQLPTEVIEAYDVEPEETISSIMTSLWNAAGRQEP
jgi:hypothetical protein